MLGGRVVNVRKIVFVPTSRPVKHRPAGVSLRRFAGDKPAAVVFLGAVHRCQKRGRREVADGRGVRRSRLTHGFEPCDTRQVESGRNKARLIERGGKTAIEIIRAHNEFLVGAAEPERLVPDGPRGSRSLGFDRSTRGRRARGRRAAPVCERP